MSTIGQGMLYMVLFGMGTVPLMTSVIYMAKFTNKIQRKKVRKLIPVVVVGMGVLFVLRGLGLGIPYISPEPVLHLVDTTMQCH